MKKYTRLCIVIISMLSLVAMVVYRYKYHTLLSVIEIGNFFTSKPAKCLKCLSSNKINLSNLTSEIISNPAHWTEIFDGIYVYSSYVISKHVMSLAYSNGVSVTELKSMKCNLWFDKGNIKSNIDVHLLNGKNNYFLFHFACKPMLDLGDPNAITFIKNDASITLPVFHKHLYTGMFSACVSPLPTVFSDASKIVEFLIYHSHLGIKHFILYYTAFSAGIRELLISLSNECDIIIEFRPWITPWNFERNRLKLQPYFIDCMFHVASLNHTDFMFLLDVDNFVVLERALNLKRLVYSNSPFDFLQLQQKLFCLEYPDFIIAKELDIKFKTLLKTKISTYDGQLKNVVYDLKQMLLNIGEAPDSFKRWLLTKTMQNYKTIKLASIFSYVNCDKKVQNFSSTTYIENTKMWSYKQSFFDSCIYKNAKFIIETHNTL